MIKPTIHINGTSGGHLLAANQAALQAVRAAYTALDASAPDPRDFHPQGARAIRAAQEEHDVRMRKLQFVLKDLNEICEHLVDQIAEAT